MKTLPSIPIEVLRTAVAIGDAGTFSKAAKHLGISQPAVSAQVKRVEQIVGGAIFEREAGKSVTTKLGNTFLLLARKTLESHDQILRLSAGGNRPEKVRVGLSPFLVAQFIDAQTSAADLKQIFIQSDRSEILRRALLDDRLDIACIFIVGDVPAELHRYIVAEREDALVWVRSSQFVVSPGQPIPIVAWRDDDWMTNALIEHGLSYQIVFDGEDFGGKRVAVEAGQGMTVLPSRFVPPTLTRAKEYYLPPLPRIRTVLLARPSNQTENIASVLARLYGLFFDSSDTIIRSGSRDLFFIQSARRSVGA